MGYSFLVSQWIRKGLVLINNASRDFLSAPINSPVWKINFKSATSVSRPTLPVGIIFISLCGDSIPPFYAHVKLVFYLHRWFEF